MSIAAETQTSRGLDGRDYPLPRAPERDRVFADIANRAMQARARGMQIVVVQGLGFVGSVMAAVVANARDEAGRPRNFVIGVDLLRDSTYWKVAMLNDGRPPVVAEDVTVGEYVRRAVRELRSLVACADERAYGLADIVVVDMQLNVDARRFGTADAVRVDMAPFREAMRTLGRMIGPDALVLVETTVPPGTTAGIVVPVLRDEFERRGIHTDPLVAHSYERVMPGPHYVRSIERFWRSYAAHDERAARRTEAFLSGIIATDKYPLRRLADTTASELAKVLENSYRAANIAFIHEWTLAAERMGVNLFEIVESIAVRRGTHDNIRRPGFGVGGYCLTKDGYLAQWGLRELFGSDIPLDLTLRALTINYEMPRHTFNLLSEALGSLSGRTVLVAGVSYLNDVADTRNSPSADFCDLLVGAGARPLVHDPYVVYWSERPELERVELPAGVAAADAAVLAVRHRDYLSLEPAVFARKGFVVVDAQDIVTDEKARKLSEGGVRVVGVGKGHWRRWSTAESKG